MHLVSRCSARKCYQLVKCVSLVAFNGVEFIIVYWIQTRVEIVPPHVLRALIIVYILITIV